MGTTESKSKVLYSIEDYRFLRNVNDSLCQKGKVLNNLIIGLWKQIWFHLNIDILKVRFIRYLKIIDCKDNKLEDFICEIKKRSKLQHDNLLKILNFETEDYEMC